MLRRTLLGGLAAATFGGQAALAQPGPAAGDGHNPALPVVASFSILADMARQVGGDSVAVTSLVPVDGDAHAYQPRPSDLRAVAGCRVLLRNGLGLEGWMDRLVRAAPASAVQVVAASGVTPRHMTEAGGGVEADPHAWQDPRNGRIYVAAIADGLARADPARADAFRARADAYSRDIAAADAWMEGLFAPIPKERRRVLTSHDAFGYFGARYGIQFIGVQGISTESEPSARDIARLIEQIRRLRIRAVFVENMTDPRTAQAVARETGAVIGGTVYSDALSAPGGPADTYLGMFRHNAPLFAQAMAAS